MTPASPAASLLLARAALAYARAHLEAAGLPGLADQAAALDARCAVRQEPEAGDEGAPGEAEDDIERARRDTRPGPPR